MDGESHRAYAPAMVHLRECGSTQFYRFLRNYARPLEVRPPLERKARYREWCDATLGEWPDNVVAKCWTRGRCKGFQVTIDEEG
jgi:hypothetical protein